MRVSGAFDAYFDVNSDVFLLTAKLDLRQINKPSVGGRKSAGVTRF
jgi:hypothetical protein